MTTTAKQQKISPRRLLFICCVWSCALAIAQAVGVSILIYLLLAAFLALFLFTDMEDHLQMLLFFAPWAALIKPFPSFVSFCSIAVLLSLGKLLLTRKIRFHTVHFIVLAALLALTLAGKLIHNNTVAGSYILFFAMLVYFPLLLFALKGKNKFEEMIAFYGVGILLATVISLIFADNRNMLEYIRVFGGELVGITRLCGFSADPNFFATQIVTAFGGLLLVSVETKRRAWPFALLAVVLALLGLISVSKSYLLCLFLVLACWLLYCLQNKKGSTRLLFLLILTTVAVFVILSTGILDKQIAEYYIRFGMAEDVSSLTTGRSDVWKAYFEYFGKNPLSLFFGQGFSSVLTGVPKGSHNTLIQMLYQLGLLGTVALFVGLFSLFSHFTASRGLTHILVVAMFCFAMWMGLDLLFFDDFFLTIALFVIALQNKREDKTNSLLQEKK